METLEDRRLFSTTLFTIDPARSELVASGMIGNTPIEVQDPGFNRSLTTSLGGTLTADVNGDVLTFAPDTSAVAAVNGNWRPGTNPVVEDVENANRQEPANFGGQAVLYGFWYEYIAARDLELAFGSHPITVADDGTFEAGGMMVTSTSGVVHYDGIEWGTIPLAGLINLNQPAEAGSFAVDGGVASLSLPVAFSLVQDVNGYAVELSFTGQITATAEVTRTPVISSVAASPTDVIEGGPMQLAAILDETAGSSVTSVSFFRESNGMPGLQPGPVGGDAPVGAGRPAANSAWVADTTAAGLRPDVYTFYALATDAAGATSAVGGDARSADVRVAPAPVNPLPLWVAPGSTATWNPTLKTLNVTGATTIIAAPADALGVDADADADADVPIIVASGAAAVVSVNTPAGGQLNLGGIQLSGHAKMNVSGAGMARTLVVSSGANFSLDATATLDLGDNALVIRNATAGAATAEHASVNNLVRTSFNSFGWDQPGITSSTAQTDVANGLPSTLGILLNDDGAGGPLFYGTGTTSPTFMGVAVDANTLMVRFTRLGDGDLNGAVDTVDFALFQAGYTGAAPYVGFAFGDYDYNGVVDTVDFGLFQAGYQPEPASASGDEDELELAEVGTLLVN